MSAIKRPKALDEENRQLKQIFSDFSIKHEALKDISEIHYHDDLD